MRSVKKFFLAFTVLFTLALCVGCGGGNELVGRYQDNLDQRGMNSKKAICLPSKQPAIPSPQALLYHRRGGQAPAFSRPRHRAASPHYPRCVVLL